MQPSSAAVAPRLLSKTQAAQYLGLTPRGFDRWRRDGKVPKPLPGTARWDKVAIDAMIDDLSKLSSLRSIRPEPEQDEGADPLAKWKARLNDQKDRRREARQKEDERRKR